MENEHYSSQVYLWLFVLRTVTRLTFLPPIQEEDEYLPGLPNTLHRHQYQIERGFVDEKKYAIDNFIQKEEGVEVIHDGVLPSSSLREISREKVCTLLDSIDGVV